MTYKYYSAEAGAQVSWPQDWTGNVTARNLGRCAGRDYYAIDNGFPVPEELRIEAALTDECASDLLSQCLPMEKEFVQSPSIMKSRFSAVIQVYLDEHAKLRGYDDIRSAALRAAFDGPFHAEGVAFAQWMDACWFKCGQILDDVMNARRAIPTVDELFSELPVLTLPGGA